MKGKETKLRRRARSGDTDAERELRARALRKTRGDPPAGTSPAGAPPETGRRAQ